jgi:flavin-binding protein dodecin
LQDLGGREAKDREEHGVTESIYKVVELVGSSSSSWEEAAKNAVETAGSKLRDLRVAEISQLDLKLVDGKVAAYRARVKVSFKCEA